MKWIVRLLVTCGLWLTLMSAAHADVEAERTHVEAAVVTPDDDATDSHTVSRAQPVDDAIDKARADEPKLDKFAISLRLVHAQSRVETRAKSPAPLPERLLSKAPRCVPNARAPPSRLAQSAPH